MKVWFLVFVLIILPQSVNAGGFWQTDKTICNGTDGVGCGPCDVVKLGKVILDWLLVIGPTIAAIIIVYAGIRLVISKGNPAEKEAAKKIMTNAIVGLVILLAAWLLVDTVMKAIGQTGWFQIQCVSNLKPDAHVTSIDTVSLGSYSLTRPTTGGNFSPDSGMGTQGSCVAANSGPCSVSALSAHFGSMASQASQIAGAESGCNPNAESRTDTTTDGRTYSVGTWQINLSAHQVSCNGTTLDCPSAFKDAGTRNKYKVKEKIVVNESLYTQCVTAAKDPDCNNAIAGGLASRSGDMGDWACSAKKCGIGTSRNHLCPF